MSAARLGAGAILQILKLKTEKKFTRHVKEPCSDDSVSHRSVRQVTRTGGLVKHCAVCVVHLLPLTQQLSLLLQDLLIKLGVKQEAATLSLHQGAAELSETPLEAILRDPHLEGETLRRVYHSWVLQKVQLQCVINRYFQEDNVVTVCQEHLSLRLLSFLHQLLDERLDYLRPLRRQTVLQGCFPPQI